MDRQKELEDQAQVFLNEWPSTEFSRVKLASVVGVDGLVVFAQEQIAIDRKEIAAELEKIANRVPTNWHRELSDVIYKLKGEAG